MQYDTRQYQGCPQVCQSVPKLGYESTNHRSFPCSGVPSVNERRGPLLPSYKTGPLRARADCSEPPALYSRIPGESWPLPASVPEIEPRQAPSLPKLHDYNQQFNPPAPMSYESRRLACLHRIGGVPSYPTSIQRPTCGIQSTLSVRVPPSGPLSASCVGIRGRNEENWRAHVGMVVNTAAESSCSLNVGDVNHSPEKSADQSPEEKSPDNSPEEKSPDNSPVLKSPDNSPEEKVANKESSDDDAYSGEKIPSQRWEYGFDLDDGCEQEESEDEEESSEEEESDSENEYSSVLPDIPEENEEDLDSSTEEDTLQQMAISMMDMLRIVNEAVDSPRSEMVRRSRIEYLDDDGNVVPQVEDEEAEDASKEKEDEEKEEKSKEDASKEEKSKKEKDHFSFLTAQGGKIHVPIKRKSRPSLVQVLPEKNVEEEKEEASNVEEEKASKEDEEEKVSKVSTKEDEEKEEKVPKEDEEEEKEESVKEDEKEEVSKVSAKEDEEENNESVKEDEKEEVSKVSTKEDEEEENVSKEDEEEDNKESVKEEEEKVSNVSTKEDKEKDDASKDGTEEAGKRNKEEESEEEEASEKEEASKRNSI